MPAAWICSVYSAGVVAYDVHFPALYAKRGLEIKVLDLGPLDVKDHFLFYSPELVALWPFLHFIRKMVISSLSARLPSLK